MIVLRQVNLSINIIMNMMIIFDGTYFNNFIMYETSVYARPETGRFCDNTVLPACVTVYALIVIFFLDILWSIAHRLTIYL